jgi:hypothetical protein
MQQLQQQFADSTGHNASGNKRLLRKLLLLMQALL